MTYEECIKIYRDKLDATGSMDAALLKVAWVAYQRGLQEAKNLTIKKSVDIKP